MRLNTFRSRIIFTVIVVVSLFSSFAFYLYSNYLSKRIYAKTEENTIAVLDMINEPVRLSLQPHNSGAFNSLVEKMIKSDQISDAYFLDSVGVLKFPVRASYIKSDSIFETDIPLIEEDLTFKTFKSEKHSLSRAFIRIQNKENCKNCHSSDTKNLGYIVFDFSINQTEKNINFTRKFSIIFTVFMVLILGGFVLLMHYRFVRGSLVKFQKSIKNINAGNLCERVPISDSRELGELAKCFNLMLDNFEETRKQLSSYHEKELQDAQKLATIGEMSARLAHEIRNPITGIANAIEIIAEDTKDKQNKPILHEIKRQATRVNEAISKLLKYAKSEKLTLDKQCINETVKSIVFFIKSQSSTKNVVFILDLQDKIPEFYFDREKIENVFLNLTLNAIDAIEEKNIRGVITYKTVYLKDKKEIKILIEDNGTGIQEDKINEIFKPFYTTKTEGTGLGMAIIKETAEKHSGTVKVESKLGIGTTFIVTLPTNLSFESTPNT
ncbi:MAG: ATP-binding protein [Bacteroidales bacterium]|nr:ATP-binding protein [Bacteroidales bacterium]